MRFAAKTTILTSQAFNPQLQTKEGICPSKTYDLPGSWQQKHSDFWTLSPAFHELYALVIGVSIDE